MLGRLWPFKSAAGAGLSPEITSELQRWRDLPDFDRRLPSGSGRWVVVDVESSGLDPLRDRLIAIGALGVVDGVVDLADSFEVVIRQDQASSVANIEVHGIGGSEQRSGEDAPAALMAFLRFVRKDPLVAFHAPFDEAMLQRAISSVMGERFKRAWLDLADVVPLAWPEDTRARRGLDDWLGRFNIPVVHRHRAIADCLATAQLFIRFLPESHRLGGLTAGSLLALSGRGRWLS